MNKKLIWVMFVCLLPIPLLTGCLTHAATHAAVQDRADWFFNPVAIYQSDTDGSLAVEGKLNKGQNRQTLAYLIIPERVLVAAHVNTKGDVSFDDIDNLPVQLRQELTAQKDLPSGFKKIADIPKNKNGMNVNERKQVNFISIGLLPFALVIDTATSPIQLYFYETVVKQLQGIN